MINGNVATAGAHVSPGDKVLIDHRLVPIKFTPDVPRVILYHKPEGEIVSHSDPGNRITVFDNLPKVENGKWLAIGRLDINTSGLLIFTTSGELANRMMHPRFEVEREYAVRILGELSEEQTQRLLTGIDIEGNADEDDEEELQDVYFDDDEEDEGQPGGAPVLRERRPAHFVSIDRRAGPDLEKTSANNWYHVVIKEGRNREVRRMFEALGLTVSRLIRVRFGKLELPPQLKRGAMIELDPGQVKDLLIWAGAPIEGMDFSAPGPQRDRHAKRGRGGKPIKPGKPVQISRPVTEGAAEGPPAEEGSAQPGRRKQRGRKPKAAAGNAGPAANVGNAKPRPRGKRGGGQGQAAGAGKPPAGKAKRGSGAQGKKNRRGGRQAEAPQPRILRAEPMTAWTGGTAHGIYGRRDGKPARQPRIIRTVTRRPRLPESEGES
jgi:23S rRNA pseudouridine2605 synthase